MEYNDTNEAGLVADARNCSSPTCLYHMAGFWSWHHYFEGIRPQLKHKSGISQTIHKLTSTFEAAISAILEFVSDEAT